LSDSGKYSMTGYNVYSEYDAVQSVIYVQVPLQNLVQKLSIRQLCDICSKHGIHLSRGHATHASIDQLISSHVCGDCKKWTCTFVPANDNTPAQKMQQSRQNVSLCISPAAQEQHRIACRLWWEKNKFPPKLLTETATNKVIRSWVTDSDFTVIHEQGCAVCGCL
jgi:hypothetical protein